MHRKPLHILLLILFISGSGPILAQSEENGVDIRNEIENRLFTVQSDGQGITTNTLADRMKDLNIPGVSIAVINNRKIEWAGGYGMKESGGDMDVTHETLFQAASLSKPVTATAVLFLAQEGLIDLDVDINDYLKSWKLQGGRYTDGQAVTLRRLLNHTAGVNVHGFRGYSARYTKLPDLKDVLDGSGQVNSEPVRVNTVPGRRWSYSGGGYTIIQQIVEDITGESFSKVMQRIVLDPVDMKNSNFDQPLPENLKEYAAYGHRVDGRGVPGGWHSYPEQAAAGLWTTPSDIAKWIIDIQDTFSGREGKVLSGKTVLEMLKPDIGGWGLGPAVGGEERTLYFSHSGSNEGFTCFMIAFAEAGQGIVIMANSDNGSQLIVEILQTVAYHHKWPALRF